MINNLISIFLVTCILGLESIFFFSKVKRRGIISSVNLKYKDKGTIKVEVNYIGFYRVVYLRLNVNSNLTDSVIKAYNNKTLVEITYLNIHNILIWLKLNKGIHMPFDITFLSETF